ncbi:unnamed protein product [Echinostoma caproni]|uniref:DUF4258 domain-containing protein n=1 Tax=Echinostoma caproni TaxID=27848 RepID=A0A183AQ19_9TREM|nr:unnamed protein product [Echinostoma caproni]
MVTVEKDLHELVTDPQLRQVIEAISQDQQYRNMQHSTQMKKPVWNQIYLNATGILMKRQRGRKCHVVVIPKQLL